MTRKPAITGFGLVTALGGDAAATWTLIAGDYIHNHSRIAGVEAGYVPRVSVLAERAATEALSAAGWGATDCHDSALVVGTSKGPIESWLGPPPLHMPYRPYDQVGRSPVFGLAHTADHLAKKLGLIGPKLTVSLACASGLHALIRAGLMTRNAEAARILVVAAESSVHPLFIHSFRGSEWWRPKGSAVGRSTGGVLASFCRRRPPAVCLEDAELPGGMCPKAVVENIALGGDATHLTGSDPAASTLKRLLARVIDARPVDFIHAHGTGTVLNDPVELVAIESSLAQEFSLVS